MIDIIGMICELALISCILENWFVNPDKLHKFYNRHKMFGIIQVSMALFGWIFCLQRLYFML